MIFNFDMGFDDQPIDKFVEQPVIIVSANTIDQNSALAYTYTQAIIDAGATPIVVAANSTMEQISSLLSLADGVLFSGGADIDAEYFGEENIEGATQLEPDRDYLEMMLLRGAMDKGVPVMGICRGCQLINVALGGSLYQDLPSQYSKNLLPHSILTDRHLGVHQVEIDPQSTLASIIGTTSFNANSRHHQAIKAVAPSLRATAHSSDGVVEAIEGYPEQKIIAVQWHPENMATTGGCNQMQQLFKFFVGETRLFHSVRKIHALNPIVDSHCDTPMLYATTGFDLGKRNSAAKVDIVKMEQGGVDATITVAYIPQRTPQNIATSMAIETLKRFSADVEKHSDRMVIARNVDQVLEAKSQGKRSAMLAIENGLAIGEDLDNIKLFASMGVVYITLCHNGSNAICDSAVGAPLYNGLSEFGKRVVERMNQLGITIDISHTSEATTRAALANSIQPIIASHSSCKALCNHPRNLSDEMIIAIADKGGVVQVCGYEGFLVERGKKASVKDIADHIDHIIKLTGYDHVGIGSDFDGGGGVEGFDGANQFMNLTLELLRRGHSESNVAKIMGGNIIRVIRNNQNR